MEGHVPEETVTYRREGRIAYITLNRPEARNAVTVPMAAELAAVLNRFDFDDEAWVAILSGNGPHFCVGIDVKERFIQHGRAERDARMSAGPPTDGHMGKTANWKPVIGAVHGLAVGLGFNLALECDLLVAAEDARFMIAETKRGIAGGQLWAKLQTFMPSKITTELLLTGDPMPAEPLYRLGLINRLVPAGEHVAAAKQLAETVLKNPPLPVRAHVRISRLPWKQLSDDAALYIQPLRLHFTQDFDEAASAFAEKRQGVYKAR
jgi:enoyl-CoA hydratase/carnithine racemase